GGRRSADHRRRRGVGRERSDRCPTRVVARGAGEHPPRRPRPHRGGRRLLPILHARDALRKPSLRLWGYRAPPAAADGDEPPHEVFACELTCRRPGTNSYAPAEQARRCCALPGFDRRKWAPERLYQIHMGKGPNYSRELTDTDWTAPRERPEIDGCPGSYTHGPFIESVLKYRRRPDGKGGRIPNRLYDLCEDEVVLEAIELLESYED